MEKICVCSKALYALLGVCSALEFSQPEAVRLGAAAVATVFYFRNTALVRTISAGVVLWLIALTPGALVARSSCGWNCCWPA